MKKFSNISNMKSNIKSVEPNINDVKRRFMGPRVTENGTQEFWGKKELLENCIRALEKMTTEEKLKFLVDAGCIM